MSDSIIQEVRNNREQHSASLDYDLDRIFGDLKIRQERHAAEGWLVVLPPASPPLGDNFELQRTRFASR